MSNYIAGEHYNYKIASQNQPTTLKALKNQFSLKINSNDGEILKFEIFNTSSDIQNTLRRLIINEVPSVAIDRVFLYNNTTCIEDSDLQLRIGLTPIDIDPDALEFYKSNLPNTDDLSTFEQDASLLFELEDHYKKPGVVNTARVKKFLDPQRKGAIEKFLQTYKDRRDKTIYSDDLVWRPFDGQDCHQLKVKPIEDIILVRMMPGEEIVLKALAVKGYGHDHAKFIPVSVAHGRRAHTLRLLAPIVGENAKTLQQLFPKGVIKIHKGAATVGNPSLLERTNKNFNEFDELKGKVELGFDENRFFWHIESVRPQYQPAAKILIAAFRSMIDKCTHYQDNLDKLLAAIKAAKDGVVDAAAFSGTLCGKRCYLEKVTKTKDYPLYRFYGETATLGVSLAFILNHLYGEKIVCAYIDFEQGIEVTVINASKKGSNDSDEVLRHGLSALGEYFEHMMNSFKEKFATFHENNVDME